MKKRGRKVPTLDSFAESDQSNMFILDMFYFLSQSRSYSGVNGMPDSIKLTEIVALFSLYGIDQPEEKLWYSELISYCDSVFVSCYIEKNKKV